MSTGKFYLYLFGTTVIAMSIMIVYAAYDMDKIKKTREVDIETAQNEMTESIEQLLNTQGYTLEDLNSLNLVTVLYPHVEGIVEFKDQIGVLYMYGKSKDTGKVEQLSVVLTTDDYDGDIPTKQVGSLNLVIDPTTLKHYETKTTTEN